MMKYASHYSLGQINGMWTSNSDRWAGFLPLCLDLKDQVLPTTWTLIRGISGLSKVYIHKKCIPKF